VVVPPSDPKKLVQAFIASEDAGFFDQRRQLHGLVARLSRPLKRHAHRGRLDALAADAKAIIASSEGAKRPGASGWRGCAQVREFILTRRLRAISTRADPHLYLTRLPRAPCLRVQGAAENYFRKKSGS